MLVTLWTYFKWLLFRNYKKHYGKYYLKQKVFHYISIVVMYAIKKNSTQIFLLGDHSPLGPWCSYHLASLASMLDSLFMGLCIVNLWIKGKICLLSFIKDLDSLTFGFLSFNATHYMCRCHLALFMWPYGGGWRRADNMATATAVSNKWSTLVVHHYLVPKCIHYPPSKPPVH